VIGVRKDLIRNLHRIEIDWIGRAVQTRAAHFG
jgi:hypothetical protein